MDGVKFMRKKLRYYQYSFEDVFGQEWETDPARPGYQEYVQKTLTDYYNTNILGEETREDYIDGKMKQAGKCKIMCQVIESGDMVEINIYPVYTGRKDVPRVKSGKSSRDAQKNLNDKNSIKRLIRLINANFHKGDLILTLTYGDRHYPGQQQARKDVQKYFREVRKERKKKGLPPLKYIYVTECVKEGEECSRIRLHHHLIMNAMDRDVAESCWKKGRVESRYAQPDDFGLEGFARYISELSVSKYSRKWIPSKNLDKPVEHKSVTLLSRRKFAEIIKSDDKAGLLEGLHQGKLKYLDSTTYVNQEYGGFYLYSRLRRKESVWGTQEEAAQPGKVACRVYLDYDWSGSFCNGEAAFSVLWEAYKKDGTPVTREKYGRLKNTTKRRAVLEMSRIALEELNPCSVEFHCCGKTLTDGIMARQFELRRKDGYRGVKDAGLIEKFMQAAEGFTLYAVSEKKNIYSEAMKIQRELKYNTMTIKNMEG